MALLQHTRLLPFSACQHCQRPVCSASSSPAQAPSSSLAGHGGFVPAMQAGQTHHRGCQLAVRAAPRSSGSSGGFNVVITGSSKGIGRALAAEFLAAGDNVVVSSRSDDRVKSTVRELSAKAKGRVTGTTCNVAKASDVAALAKLARSELGDIDLWINNAGSNAYKFQPLVDNTEAELVSIVETNVLGTMLCCREAINLMRGQPRGGLIYNMEGAGADGNATANFAAYGATKRGLKQLCNSLQAELKAAGVNNVGVHALSPGMVTTELLMSGVEERPRAQFFVNVLAETAQTCAQVLVPQLRSCLLERQARGAAQAGVGKDIRFLTKLKAYSQLAARLAFGARKNKFVQEAQA